MKFVVDEQLPPALAVWLRSQGHDAVHIHDEGLGGAADSDIWQLCVMSAAIIVTKDRDFVIRRSVATGPGVVWIRLGNMRVGDLMRRIRDEWPRTLQRLVNQVVVELP